MRAARASAGRLGLRGRGHCGRGSLARRVDPPARPSTTARSRRSDPGIPGRSAELGEQHVDHLRHCLLDGERGVGAAEFGADPAAPPPVVLSPVVLFVMLPGPEDIAPMRRVSTTRRSNDSMTRRGLRALVIITSTKSAVGTAPVGVFSLLVVPALTKSTSSCRGAIRSRRNTGWSAWRPERRDRPLPGARSQAGRPALRADADGTGAPARVLEAGSVAV